MKSNSTYRLAKTFLEDAPLAALVALALWLIGAYSGSVAVMLASGVLGFGRPLFLAMLLNLENRPAKPARLNSLRTSAAAVR